MRADRVRRVEKVRLSAFRGWTQEHEVPLGADLVLVSAANGRGKSSLLEALGWALNGWPQHSMGDNEVVSAGRESRVTVEFDGGECEVRGREEPSAPEDEALGAETMRRATWFTQDPLDNQFETAGDGNDTLLGFLAPFPEWLERYEREVVRAIKRIDSQRPDEDAGRELASARRRRDEAAAALVVAFGPASSDALQSNDEPLKVALELVESHLEVRAPGGVPTPEWFASVRRVLVQGSRQGGRWEEALAVLEAAKGARDDFEAVWPEVPCAALRGWAGGPCAARGLGAAAGGLGASARTVDRAGGGARAPFGAPGREQGRGPPSRGVAGGSDSGAGPGRPRSRGAAAAGAGGVGSTLGGRRGATSDAGSRPARG